ncbi:Neuropeptide Y receptor type 6 [Clonorchis sinensis]|uniref:Neuropeptide Y receptor type 6 n=1 Tax=Clonorchis sinensis TaxID=79923 RepID=A0A8T1M1R4_CLOSI|nr:Neuropeptide Y receptor type 6 [Clonorchis sinensis]
MQVTTRQPIPSQPLLTVDSEKALHYENNAQYVEKCIQYLLNGSQPTQIEYSQTSYSSHRIPIVRDLMISHCTLFSITGVIFNMGLMCALLKYHRQTLKDNITNLFVFCLSVSDIFLCSVSMPVQMFYEINEHQLASSGLCRVLFAGFGLPLSISCLTILLIAFDRYRMIVHPMKIQISNHVAMSLIGCVILFGGLISIPVALHVDIDIHSGFAYCVEKWPSARLRLAYSVFVFIACFALPLSASGGFYLAIYCRLAKQSTQLGFRKETERRKRRTTSLLVLTVVCFALCWTPWCLYSLLLEIESMLRSHIQETRAGDPLSISGELCQALLLMSDQALKQALTHSAKPRSDEDEQLSGMARGIIIPAKHTKLIDLLCKMIAMGSTFVNPFIYGCLNEPIQLAMRRQYGRLTACLRRGSTRGRHNSTTASKGGRKAQTVDGTEMPSMGVTTVQLINCTGDRKSENCALNGDNGGSPDNFAVVHAVKISPSPGTS